MRLRGMWRWVFWINILLARRVLTKLHNPQSWPVYHTVYKGDCRGSIGSDRGDNGPPYWFLHTQRGRDHLLPLKVLIKNLLRNFFHSFISRSQFPQFQPVLLTYTQAQIHFSTRFRFFMALRVPKAQVVSAVNKRSENHFMTKMNHNWMLHNVREKFLWNTYKLYIDV